MRRQRRVRSRAPARRYSFRLDRVSAAVGCIDDCYGDDWMGAHDLLAGRRGIAEGSERALVWPSTRKRKRFLPFSSTVSAACFQALRLARKTVQHLAPVNRDPLLIPSVRPVAKCRIAAQSALA